MLDTMSFYSNELNKKEFHVFYRETRVFIMKQKLIKEELYWTCKSCLSYVSSFKEKDFDIAAGKIRTMVEEFVARFK
jgi:hypothetical protein